MLMLTPLLSHLTIKSKNLDYRKFDLNYIDPVDGDLSWAQRPLIAEIERQYNAGHPVRIIVLKARQLGISTATEGVLFNWSFIHPGTNGLVLTHERKQSGELFQMTKTFWDTWPFKRYFTTTSQTKGELAWLETKSKLSVGTAKNLTSGRGSTFHALHASECAFYEDPDTVWTGLNESIPSKHGTIIVRESTANGVGNWFYDQWNAAEEGESEYVPLFFPWWKHSEYRMATTLTVRSELTDDERLVLGMMNDAEVRYPFEAIAWRRYKIIGFNGDEGKFRQEYPATPEEAFVTSGRPVFSHDKLRVCFREEKGVRGILDRDSRGRVRFTRDDSGSVILFRRPQPGDHRQDRYFLAGDPSMTIQGDPACMQVINRATYEQVAVWHGQIDAIHFAKEMELLGEFYNTCMVCPETEGGGQATIATLLNDSYPSIWQHRWADKAPGKVALVFGWLTNYNRKRWAIGILQRLIIDGTLIIHDRITYNQLRSYVYHSDGSLGNEGNNTHDDAVMALSIAVTASQTEGVFMPDSSRNDPIFDIYQQEFEAV